MVKILLVEPFYALDKRVAEERIFPTRWALANENCGLMLVARDIAVEMTTSRSRATAEFLADCRRDSVRTHDTTIKVADG